MTQALYAHMNNKKNKKTVSDSGVFQILDFWIGVFNLCNFFHSSNNDSSITSALSD
jgi:hypothetical protein